MVRADGYFSVAPLDAAHRPMLRGGRWLSKGAERDTWRRRRAVAARLEISAVNGRVYVDLTACKVPSPVEQITYEGGVEGVADEGASGGASDGAAGGAAGGACGEAAGEAAGGVASAAASGGGGSGGAMDDESLTLDEVMRMAGDHDPGEE